MMCSYPLWEMLRCDLDEASGGVDDSMFVVWKLAAALLLGPQLAADALPTVPGSGADAVVLAAACAGAGGAAGKPVAVDLGRVNHWVVAHGGVPGGVRGSLIEGLALPVSSVIASLPLV